jgi:cation diffusion facilitator family transporter
MAERRQGGRIVGTKLQRRVAGTNWRLGCALIPFLLVESHGTGALAQTLAASEEPMSHQLTSFHHIAPFLILILFPLLAVPLLMPGLTKWILVWLGFRRSSDHHHDGHHHHHDHGDGHAHTHGVMDATIATTERGIWAIKWSFAILMATAGVQFAAYLASGSVALLADLIHNVGDASTAIPLWFAFLLARRKPTSSFPYGLGRLEDLAGIAIVVIILISAIVAGTQAIDRLLNPQPVTQIGWLIAAGLIGFVGNEVVAVLRMRVGREIGSAALIADGHHARVDGLTSLAVVLGGIGVWLGFPLADPIIGLMITVAILGIVWQSARSVLTRMLDGIDPQELHEIEHCAQHVAGVQQLVSARARWIGHKLHADVAIAVDESSSVKAAQAVIEELRQVLFAHMPALAMANISLVTAVKAEAHGHGHHEHEHDHDHTHSQHHHHHDDHDHHHGHDHSHSHHHDDGHHHPHGDTHEHHQGASLRKRT